MKKFQSPYFSKVVLVGVGLIGGSLTLDLLCQRLAGSVVGFGRDVKNLSLAKKSGIISTIGKNLANELPTADLVIFAVPVKTMRSYIERYAHLISPDALVIDVGSTKQNIVKDADRFFLHGNFVGCHPMAGKESFGAKACELNFFQNKVCLVTASHKTKKRFLSTAVKLWQLVGAKIIKLSSEMHDKKLAVTSHFPQIISSLLMLTAGKNYDLKDLKKLMGSGFKDTTRLAASHAGMWTEIILENKKNILEILELFQRELTLLCKEIENESESSILKTLQAARHFKQEII